MNFKTSSNWDGWTPVPGYQDTAYTKTYGPGCTVTVLVGSVMSVVAVNDTFYCECKNPYFARQIAEMYMYTHGGIEDNE